MTRREPTSEQDQPRPFSQEPESFHGRPITFIGIGMLVVFAVGMLWATQIFVSRSKDLAPDGSSPARELGRRQIGIVDQVPYEQMREAATTRRARLHRLESYGYVDQERGVVHVPVERAYDLVIAEQKGGGK